MFSDIQCITQPSYTDSGPAAQAQRGLIFSSERVPIVTDFFVKMLIVRLRNEGEWGISHASLYSLRDHSFDCNRPWRLCWAPRESRGCRALEGRLAKRRDSPTYLSLRQMPPRLGLSGRGSLCMKRTRWLESAPRHLAEL